MGSIESSIGKVSSKISAAAVQQPKHFVVENADDESFDNENPFDEYEDFIQESNETMMKKNSKGTEEDAALNKVVQMRKEKNIITKDSKSKIEALLGLKSVFANTEIDGLKITLKNLTALDMKNAFDKISQISKTKLQEVFDTRNVFICLSLYKLDDELLTDILGDDDDIDTRLSLVENMSEDVVTILENLYNSKIKINLPKTNEEAKEVIKEIKK